LRAEKEKVSRRPAKDPFATRDFFLSVLESSATKRDARSYIKTFNPSPPRTKLQQSKRAEAELKQVPAIESKVKAINHGGVNLGSFYAPRALESSPQFLQPGSSKGNESISLEGPRHIALVKIRRPQDMKESTLDGIARTLAQLQRLGMTSTVVLDCGDELVGEGGLKWKDTAIEQVDRLVALIDGHSEPGARRSENVIGVLESNVAPEQSNNWTRGKTHVRYRTLLLKPLLRGIIPVVAPIGWTDETQRAVPVKADDVCLALAREFAGLAFAGPPPPEEDPVETKRRLQALKDELSLDRLIVVDPLGGIPTTQRSDGYHVFLNLEQEYHVVKNDLVTSMGSEAMKSLHAEIEDDIKKTDLGKSNPFSGFAEHEVIEPTQHAQAVRKQLNAQTADSLNSSNLIHLNNLELARSVLAILPPSSSALITTPWEAANSSAKPDSVANGTPGVGTRTQRNPLIHNLLTDKPVFSSSLPTSRVKSPNGKSNPAAADGLQQNGTTFIKRGIPVTIFPDPSIHPWTPPVNGVPQISLTDPRIDLTRLVHLINDSFDRKLDVPAYLERIKDRVAGVIIAGEYEGGALLTWELSPDIPADAPDDVKAQHWVPYLDKFAVLKRSQGSGGVADVVFKSMVREAFPTGVCWRSRQNNPVNKWYFERSRGTVKLKGGEWTMFWTTRDVAEHETKFQDYEGVCKSIQPTWVGGGKANE
jgi:amino-acid N-acetyltransferase